MEIFSIRLEDGPEDRQFVESLDARLVDVIDLHARTREEIAAFQASFTSTAWSEENASGATFLAENEAGHRVGYVHVREGVDDILEEPCGYIALLAVSKNCEGKGVAQALVRRAEEWTAEAGFSRLTLDVFSSNTRALSFYDRQGFRAETVRLVKTLREAR
ncbi:GNAT family N-acetyltransferase [Aurantiacibacter sediminis]|uniref:GNAT family N-acetyltransferase n=1 Tax=Aurantiacibacter sediminis TaxID=2793064 RepID=A0ABS0N034_9SPHN|nr:GNAT family N-acetyltransferase [Aurantiacibacter sediminis]MBH5321323.1 GNAT family N-acetyltransferase [Aurantiacibacter sediminis]